MDCSRGASGAKDILIDKSDRGDQKRLRNGANVFCEKNAVSCEAARSVRNENVCRHSMSLIDAGTEWNDFYCWGVLVTDVILNDENGADAALHTPFKREVCIVDFSKTRRIWVKNWYHHLGIEIGKAGTTVPAFAYYTSRFVLDCIDPVAYCELD